MDGPTFNQEYIQRLASCDESTVKHFFDHFTGVLGVKLRGQGLPSQIIEEIRQETLFRVYRSVKQGSPIERLDAYVRGVCNNVVHESQRSEWRYQGLPDDMTELADVSWRPEESWITQERLNKIRLVLDGLHEKDRMILRGIYLEDRDKDDLCRELGVDREYLRVLVHRAMTRAKLILDKNQGASA